MYELVPDTKCYSFSSKIQMIPYLGENSKDDHSNCNTTFKGKLLLYHKLPVQLILGRDHTTKYSYNQPQRQYCKSGQGRTKVKKMYKQQHMHVEC